MHLSDFDYTLPPELIAQYPPKERGASRMLVLDRRSGACQLNVFSQFPDYLNAGDCLVLNDTQVIPARLLGRRRPTGGRVEILLLEELANGGWHCFLKPGRRMKPGQIVELDNDPEDTIRIDRRREDGSFEISFPQQDPHATIEKHGSIPLPPYIERAPTEADMERYQTVFAAQPGAVAAPTAGLHFTPEILQRVRDKDVNIASVTLHVGPGTFRPVKAEHIQDHQMHEERYVLPAAAADLINQTRARNKRIVAIGTTSVRVLETAVDKETGLVAAGSGRTRLFMHPPMKPAACDGLLTNFHLPRSTLLMLVATFSSVDRVLNAYHLAVREQLRFYSYGDCMLLI